jgi:hypothetical protein
LSPRLVVVYCFRSSAKRRGASLGFSIGKGSRIVHALGLQRQVSTPGATGAHGRSSRFACRVAQFLFTRRATEMIHLLRLGLARAEDPIDACRTGRDGDDRSHNEGRHRTPLLSGDNAGRYEEPGVGKKRVRSAWRGPAPLSSSANLTRDLLEPREDRQFYFRCVSTRHRRSRKAHLTNRGKKGKEVWRRRNRPTLATFPIRP